MEVTKFDALGRLTLPIEMAAQFRLCENSRLLMTVSESEKHLLLRPTQEEAQPADCAEDIRQTQVRMLQKSAGEWRYIRALDNRLRVVLPRVMRELLAWAEHTRLKIDSDDDAIYVREDERR